jgi:hypothetical protein
MGDHGLIVGGLGLGHRQFRLDPGCPGRFLDPLRALLDQRRQCKFGSPSLNSKFITSDISSIGKEKDHRAWLDAAGRALQRRGVGPAANVVGRIEIGIYTAPPRVWRSLECRDFEFERLPVGIDYQVQQKRVP